ncbi:hypothetical protein OKA04_19060 [Luteolibacter flavescens]|uniref:CcoQ/FixQ family Cbb3-type cytochrome c oxidase assembly chaperone n=1 Tax=Luteolibacter flavescens TaxID=1859460 RepID=A0ABT3FTE3_9BACT|nr:hypothetical protein [Luteolibacter flavescens]MCW1886848.1 hypothetical protein [Luteolibacter flavescens]
MFKRIILDEWANLVPMVAFGVLFTVFLVTTLRAIRLKPDEQKRMADLPLQDSDKPSDP